MYANKPVIGIAGGIGSGKSFVAALFGEAGCLVINSDEQVAEAYALPDVREALRAWWGDSAFKPDGAIDRRAIAGRVFADPAERVRLEQLLHPIVDRLRAAAMAAAAGDPEVLAFVWDTPLLFETGLHRQCDAVVFVETPLDVRQARVARRSGWDDAELGRREKFQLPLDNKQGMSEYNIRNTAGADQARIQVRETLSRILAGTKSTARQPGSSVTGEGASA